MSRLLTEEMLVLFAILALGSWAGQLTVKTVSLGSAGVFFVALVFGHLGMSVPREVMDLGLLLFVYAIGLQAGPRFFRTFRHQGLQFVIIASVTVATGGLVTIVLAQLMGLRYDLAAGLFAGAVTNTPALAAAIDAVNRIAAQPESTVSVGYGIAYPFSMIGVVLLIQFLPRLLRRDVRSEEERWRVQAQAEDPALQARKFLITNPNVNGKMLRDVNPHRMSLANISRVRHENTVFPAAPDTILYQGDVVMAVGPETELDKMRLLLGEETQVPMDTNTNVMSVDAEITQGSLTGQRLADLKVWERYGVVITRIRRQGLEITPVGLSTLEMGDTVRVVGERAHVEAFVQLVSGGHRADETNMVPFLAGLLLGILVGLVPFNLSGGVQVRLGIAGGAFLVSLLVGHFGRLGPFRLHVPAPARNLVRELGLMLFLAGAGANAGSRLVSVLQEQGWGLLLAGVVITTSSVLAGLLVMHRVYRMNLLSTMGALSACMTNPPALGAANAQTDTELPMLVYASVFPVVLIFKILMAQLLVEIMRGMS